MRQQLLCMSLIFLVISVCVPSALAHEIAVLKSLDIKPYDDAVKGFKGACCNSKVREYVISNPNSSREIDKIHKSKPDVILAIGMNALVQVRVIKDTPIVYAMISNPESVIKGQENITGVSMNVSPEKQLQALREVLPYIEKVGIVYDPRKSAHLFEEAQLAASQLGITIISKRVFSSQKVLSAIKALEGEIDAYWMLPDMTVITKESVEYLFLFSFENDIPILSFSEKYVELGALMALTIDAEDIGKQAGGMAKEILSGTDVGDIPMSSPKEAIMFLNLRIAKHCGIEINEEIIRKSNIVE